MGGVPRDLWNKSCGISALEDDCLLCRHGDNLQRMKHLAEFCGGQTVDAPECADEVGGGTKGTGGGNLFYAVGGFKQELFCV